jgi:hypothetical protein
MYQSYAKAPSTLTPDQPGPLATNGEAGPSGQLISDYRELRLRNPNGARHNGKLDIFWRAFVRWHMKPLQPRFTTMNMEMEPLAEYSVEPRVFSGFRRIGICGPGRASFTVASLRSRALPEPLA